MSGLKLCYKQWAGQTQPLSAVHLKASVAFQIVNYYEILTNHNMSSSASFSLLSPINAF